MFRLLVELLVAEQVAFLCMHACVSAGETEGAAELSPTTHRHPPQHTQQGVLKAITMLCSTMNTSMNSASGMLAQVR